MAPSRAQHRTRRTPFTECRSRAHRSRAHRSTGSPVHGVPVHGVQVHGVPVHGVQGTLALAFVLPSGVPAVPEPPPDLHLVSDGAISADEFGPRPTRRAALPAPRTWAGQVVQAIVEVLAGVRPATQLVRWTTEEVYEEISSRVLVAHGSDTEGPPRGVVRSLHVSEPADGVAEVCALVRRGARSTVVALRLEGMDGRWQCTAIELG
jgi:hypothetical protein